MNSNAIRNASIGALALMVVVLLVAVGFLGRIATEGDRTVLATGDEPGGSSAPAAVSSDDIDFNLLGEILGVLEEDFFEPDRIDLQYLYEGAINGIFDALDDPHSTYIDPATYAISRDDFSGAFQGIGATIQAIDNFVVIVRPLPDTPAEAAGLLPGDQILEVDGVSAEGWTVERAVAVIRGPQGTPVDLKIRHTDGTIEVVTIIRDEILVASVSASPPGGVLLDSNGDEATDIGYIYIRNFTRRTPGELAEAVAKVVATGVTGLILDVRSNPGGLLVETTQVADMFLDEGFIVFQVDRDGNEQEARARPGQVTDLPIVIVQDEFSASGSELLAGALQDNGRATIVGTRSFGKGTVNHVRELSNGGAVYVSIATWLTPNRNQIEGLGIQPDILIELTLDDIEARRDVAIIRAIDVLRNAS